MPRYRFRHLAALLRLYLLGAYAGVSRNAVPANQDGQAHRLGILGESGTRPSFAGISTGANGSASVLHVPVRGLAGRQGHQAADVLDNQPASRCLDR